MPLHTLDHLGDLGGGTLPSAWEHVNVHMSKASRVAMCDVGGGIRVEAPIGPPSPSYCLCDAILLPALMCR